MSIVKRLLLLLLLGCWWLPGASAAPVSEPRPASGVTRIEVRVPIELSVRQGDAEGIVLTGEADQLKRVKTTVEGNTLIIDQADESWHSRRSVKGVVTVKMLTALQLTGAGSVDFATFKAGHLELAIAGAGNLDLAGITAERLAISISGTGHVIAAGTAAELDVHIAGVGDASLEGLEAATAHVSISGSGAVKVAARDHLDANISGVGEIKYRGSPSITKNVSGLGSVAAL